MAVRNDFTAGEVLAAADLNDTFASKGDVAGETWTGTHDFTGATVTGTFPANDGAEVLTGEATTSTSFTDLTTAGPAVTLTTGTKAFVIISCWLRNNNSGQLAAASFAVSGATTRAASSDEALRITATANSQPALKMSVGFIVEGLTAGSNTFTMKYRVSGGSGDFEDRQISVIDMGS